MSDLNDSDNDKPFDDAQGKEPMLYELAYILDPGIAEERLAEHAGKITGVIEKHKGALVLADNPKLRGLAYTIERATGGKRQKYNQGYFGWIKFTATSSAVVEIEREIKQRTEVIRHMLIHTVKSVAAYVPRRPADAPRADTGDKPVEKLTEAELDKEVDDLIASTGPAPATLPL